MKKEYKYTINGKPFTVTIGETKGNETEVTVNGEAYTVAAEPEAEPVKARPVVKPAAAVTPPPTNPQRNTAQNALRSPLPGTITEVSVAVGDTVEAGQTVVILEAMKMANHLEAEHAGVVKEVYVQAGQAVMENDALLLIE